MTRKIIVKAMKPVLETILAKVLAVLRDCPKLSTNIFCLPLLEKSISIRQCILLISGGAT